MDSCPSRHLVGCRQPHCPYNNMPQHLVLNEALPQAGGAAGFQEWGQGCCGYPSTGNFMMAGPSPNAPPSPDAPRFVGRDQLSVIPLDELARRAEASGVGVPEGLSRGHDHRAPVDTPLDMDAAMTEREVAGPAKINYLLSPFMPDPSTALLCGSPDSGRSWLALTLGYRVALGGGLFGKWEAGNPRKALYLSGDIDKDILHDRVFKLKRALAPEGLANTGSAGNFMFHSLKRMGMDLLDGGCQSRIERILFPPEPQAATRLLIIDSLRSLTDFDMRDRYWKALFQWFAKLGAKGCSTMGVNDIYDKDDPNMFGFDSVIQVQKNAEAHASVLKLTIKLEKCPVPLKASDRSLKAEINLDACVPAWKDTTPAMSRQEKDALIAKCFDEHKMPIDRIAAELGVTRGAIDKRLKILKRKGCVTTTRRLSKPGSDKP